MSLRARLIIGLVALAGAGLLLVGAVTYAEQRSFLYDRVNDRLDAAVPVVTEGLDRKLGLKPARERDRGPRGGALPGAAPEGRGGPPRRGRQIELGARTYGERRRVEIAEPRTEVGRLGLALNAMLARLEEAFAERRASEERLRRFLADASHELRTPLASIRGYAELFRIGAAREGAEIEKAMARIEDESARMGVLVEDLLALARLDEVRETDREPVDIAALAGDAVEDARAVAPGREIELRRGGDGSLVLDGDPAQLRQVLANLMRNALVHTPAGTPIEVSVSSDGRDVTLDVRDHGPGLPSGDPDALFERFWRAEAGRGRGRSGAGLGLSIVAAIVSAHGGRAQATNAPGGGARFTITLPVPRAQRRSAAAAPGPEESAAPG